MRNFKHLYGVVSYTLLIVQLGILSILFYNKILNRPLYYGTTTSPADISEHYFVVLKTFLYSTFALMVAWALLTPVAVISNKRSTHANHIGIGVGLIGFIMAGVLLMIDPFGMFKWFSGV